MTEGWGSSDWGLGWLRAEGAMHISNWKCELLATRSANKHVDDKAENADRDDNKRNGVDSAASYLTRESGCCACHARVQDRNVRLDDSASIWCSIFDRLIDNIVTMASVKQWKWNVWKKCDGKLICFHMRIMGYQILSKSLPILNHSSLCNFVASNFDFIATPLFRKSCAGKCRFKILADNVFRNIIRSELLICYCTFLVYSND